MAEFADDETPAYVFGIDYGEDLGSSSDFIELYPHGYTVHTTCDGKSAELQGPKDIVGSFDLEDEIEARLLQACIDELNKEGP